MVPLSTGAELDDIFRRKKVQSLVSQAPPVPENLNINQFPGNANVTQDANEKKTRVLAGLQNLGKQLTGEAPQGQVQPQEFPLQKRADPGQFLKDPYNIPPTQVTEAPPAIQPTAPEIPEATPTVSKILEANVAPIRPYEPTPETQALVKKELQGPGAQSEWEKAHQTSKKRHLGALLAGIGTGILYRRPDKGMQMYSEIQHAPYLREVEKWQQEKAPLERIVGDIQKDIGSQVGAFSKRATGEAALERAATGATKAPSQIHRAEAEAGKAEAGEVKLRTETPGTPEHEAAVPQIVKETEDIARAKEAGKVEGKPEFFQARLIGSEGWTTGLKRDKSGKLTDQTGAEIPRDKIIEGPYKEGGNRPRTSISPDMAAWELRQEEIRKSGREPTSKDAIKLRRELHPQEPIGIALKQVQLDMARMKEEAQKREVDPENVANLGDELAGNPASIADTRRFTKENEPLVRDYMLKHWGVHLPAVPKQSQLSLLSNGLTSKNLLYTIRDEMRENPELAKQMGPIAGGLIGGTEAKIGSDVFSGNPKLAQAASRLRGNLQYLKGVEASMLGQRGATQYLVQLVNDVTASMKMGPSRFEGALQAAMDTADARITTYGQDAYGPDYVKVSKSGKQRPQITVIDGQLAAWNPEANGYQIGGLQ